MADEMLERKETFTAKHYVFYQKNGGNHDFEAVRECLYNALPLFFKCEFKKHIQKKVKSIRLRCYC